MPLTTKIGLLSVSSREPSWPLKWTEPVKLNCPEDGPVIAEDSAGNSNAAPERVAPSSVEMDPLATPVSMYLRNDSRTPQSIVPVDTVRCDAVCSCAVAGGGVIGSGLKTVDVKPSMLAEAVKANM